MTAINLAPETYELLAAYAEAVERPIDVIAAFCISEVLEGEGDEIELQRRLTFAPVLSE